MKRISKILAKTWCSHRESVLVGMLFLIPLAVLGATCATCNWKDEDSCGKCCIVRYLPTLKECGSPFTSNLECLTDSMLTTIGWTKSWDPWQRTPCQYVNSETGTFSSYQCFNDDTMCY